MGFQTGGNVPPGMGAMPGVWNPMPWQPGRPQQLGMPRQPWAARGARPPIDIGALLAGQLPAMKAGNMPGPQPGNAPGMGPRGNALANLGRLLGPGAGAQPNAMGGAKRCPLCGSPMRGAPLRAQPVAQPQPGFPSGIGLYRGSLPGGLPNRIAI